MSTLRSSTSLATQQALTRGLLRARLVARSSAAVAMTIAIVVLLGWANGSVVLKSLLPGYITMKVNTAVCFLLLGAAVWALARQQTTKRQIVTAPITAALTLTVAGLSIIQDACGWNFGIDQALFADTSIARGRMALGTAVIFVLLALAVLLRCAAAHHLRRLSDWPALTAAFIATLALNGYCVGLSAAFSIDASVTIALHTAFAAVCLAVGVLALGAEEGLISVIFTPFAGSYISQRLLPLALLLSFGLSMLDYAGRLAGWFSAAFADLMFPVVSGWTLVCVIAWTGTAVNRHQADQQRANEALRESEERFRDLFENTSDLVQSVAPDGRIVYVNRAWHRTLGYVPAELPALRIFDVIAPECASHCREAFQRVMRGEMLDAIAVQFVAKDGRIVHLEGNTHCQMVGGKPIATRGIFRDCTARKQAEAALQASEENARLVLETAYDAFVEIDAGGRILQWNPRASELFGWSRSEAIGRRLSETIIPPSLRERHEQGLQHYLATGEGPFLRRTIELSAIHRDSREIPVELTIWPVSGRAGNRFGAFIHDISDRKAAQSALAQARDTALKTARLKSEFLANMSHEIRTPMNGIIGMLSLIVDTPLTTQQRDFAETALTSAESLLIVLNDILDFSKIEAGKLTIEETDFDPRELVETTLELLAASAQSKGLELVGEVRTEPGLVLRGDPTRLRQVLVNLAGNAIKFTSRGEVVVRVAVEPAEGCDLMLRIEVRDTGIGIPADVVPKLFHAFTQADGSTSRRFGGTGLGLAISRRLAELMGGEIHASSEPQCGSVFSFSARVRRSDTPLNPPRRAALAGRRVIVVDDNATNRAVLHNQLTGWGVADTLASDAREALRLLKAAAEAGTPFALAVLDLQMPEMDGVELARAIQAEPALAETRVVILTSLGMRLDDATQRAAGIQECLFKPVRQARLFDALSRAIAAEPVAPVPVLVPVVPASLAPAANPLRILLAEDNAVNQKVALSQLHKLGRRADVVANGRDAVEAHARAAYDVIFMDCHMPEMEGYEATQRIRQAEAIVAPARLVRIIALTAHALEEERAKCLAAGMDDYLCKPVSVTALAGALDRALAAQSQPHTLPA